MMLGCSQEEMCEFELSRILFSRFQWPVASYDNFASKRSKAAASKGPSRCAGSDSAYLSVRQSAPLETSFEGLSSVL